MNAYDGSWDPHFPQVMHFVDLKNCCAKPWKLLEAHPCYEAAKKNENHAAALHLVYDLLKTRENQSQLEFLKQNYSNAIIIPVRAMEAGGKNRIPEALAEYIGQKTGFNVNTEIVQSNKVFRTGSDEWHRFAFRPTFDGQVTPNRKYLLVDDVFAQGGSFNELRLFIERNGGKVVQTASLSLGGHGNKIAPEPQLTKSLIDKFGSDKLSLFLKEIDLYDGNYKALTNPETFALRRSSSLDEARDRILAARCQRKPSMVSESIQEIGNKTPAITSIDENVRRGIRR